MHRLIILENVKHAIYLNATQILTPTIIVDKQTKEAKFIVGGAGGTKITTGILQVILNTFFFKYSAGDAVARQRLHHQLSPNELRWQDGVDGIDGPAWAEMMHNLRDNRGHELDDGTGMDDVPVIHAIYKHADGTIEAASDPRHSGVPDGF